MASFGAKLRAEREKRSITLDQISLTTKIGTRMLQALEEDKFSQLPGGIFNKGFVRAYARCVGIDEEQAVSDYLEASGESPRPRMEGDAEGDAAPRIVFSEDTSHEFRSSAKSSRELPWGLFAAALLVIALALSLWTHQQHHAAPVTPATTVRSNPVAAPDVSSTATGTANSPNAGGTKLGKGAEAMNSTKPGTGARAGMPEPQAPTVAEKIPGAPASPQPGEFTVLIQGHEDCWISITADGKALPSFMLNAGDQRAISGQQSIIIRAGNIGGIEVSFNGKKLAAQGESGEVKTLTFGPEGLRANAPAPAATQ